MKQHKPSLKILSCAAMAVSFLFLTLLYPGWKNKETSAVLTIAEENNFMPTISSASNRTLPENSAKAACVMTGDGILLGGKNENEFLPIASTTKIMTALVTLEAADGKLDETFLTGEEVKVEGSALGIAPEAEVTPRLLVWGMLLSSGNDAAEAAAAHFGGKEIFLQKMNRRASLLGMNSTRFITPSGLDADGHGSTARDMALLTAEALRNSDFLEICSQTNGHLTIGETEYWMTNHNKLLKSYPDCIGVKTGFTKKAGRCLVSAARRKNTTIISVVLNDADDWNDSTLLLDWGFEQLEERVLSVPDSFLSSLTGQMKTDLPIRLRSNPVLLIPPEEELTPTVSILPSLSENSAAGITVGILRWIDSRGKTRAWTAIETAE